LKFKLADVPTGSGTSTVKVGILDHIGADSGASVQASGESGIELTATVSYLGNGTTATLTVPVQSASGKYKKIRWYGDHVYFIQSRCRCICYYRKCSRGWD
jgi:hypothetical protein